MRPEFDWDPVKAEENFRKHGVSFFEASTVFSDLLAVTLPDPLHSAREDRYILVGKSYRDRLVVVAH